MRLIFVLAFATVVDAQWSAIAEQIRPGEEIRLGLSGKRSLQGRLGDVSDTGLTILRRGKPVRIAMSEVSRAYRFEPRPRKRSILAGTAIGGGAGVVIGVAGVKKADLVEGFAPFAAIAGAGIGGLRAMRSARSETKCSCTRSTD